MSIRLPRNSKELHFTGSVRALGQERPKGPPPPPPSRSVPAPIPAVPSVMLTTPTRLTTMRGQLASIDDDMLTEALDRDIINQALFPIARRENASQPPPNLPVPHFRSAAEAHAHHAERTIIVTKPPQGGAFPLGAWLIAALIAGIVSYQLAPQARNSLAEAVRALDSNQ